MAIIKKTIAKPGKYLVRTLAGERVVHSLSKADLIKAAKTANEMLKDGLLISAPYGHSDSNKVVPIPVYRDPNDPKILLDAKTKQPARWDHALNAGFWQSFEVEDDGSLVGYLEPGDDEHAKRLGTTFRQVSPMLHGQWIDGTGKLRENALLHVCVTNKAVAPGQSNFKAMPDETNLAIAMTLSEDDFISMSNDDEGASSFEQVGEGDKDPASKGGESEETPDDNTDVGNPAMSEERIGKIIVELKGKWGVTLPDDTNSSNFLDRLFTILCNSESEEEEESELDAEPEEGKAPQSPVVMALDQEIATKRTNALLAKQTADTKSGYKNRVEALVSSGRLSRAKADKDFMPKVEAFAMSLDDLDDEANLANCPIAMALDLLEEAPSLTGEEDTKVPEQGKVPNTPTDMRLPGDVEVSQEEADKILDEQPINRRSYRPTM